MALKKHFLKPTFTDISVPKWQIGLGFVIYLGFSYTFFLFLMVIRESIRNVNIGLLDSLMKGQFIPTDVSWFWSNVGLAAVALLFGQSVMLQFWWLRPRQWKENRIKRRRLAIVNDSRVGLNVTLLVWFPIITTVTISGFDFVMIFFAYNPFYIFWLIGSAILLFMLLYFHQWNNWQRAFKNSQKWMYSSFFATIALTFLFSFTYPSAFKKYNESQLARSFQDQYELELVSLKHIQKIERRSLNISLALAYPKHSSVEIPDVLFLDDYDGLKPLDSTTLVNYLIQARLNRDFDDRPLMSISIAVGKNVEMKHLQKWLRILQEQGFSRFQYFGKPEKGIHYFDLVLNRTMVPTCDLDKPIDKNLSFELNCPNRYKDLINTIVNHKNPVLLHLTPQKLWINGQVFPKNQTEKALNSFYTNTSKNLLLLWKIENEVLFEDYIRLLDAETGIYKSRINYVAQQLFQKDYENLTYPESDKVKQDIEMKTFILDNQLWNTLTEQGWVKQIKNRHSR